MNARGILTRIENLLNHRHLPLILAAGAILLMLPSLRLGLIADDLPQRMIELRPDQFPARIQETGMLPAGAGPFPCSQDRA